MLDSRLLRSGCHCRLMAGSLCNLWLDSRRVETLPIRCMLACGKQSKPASANNTLSKWSSARANMIGHQYVAAAMLARQGLPNNCSTLHCIPQMPCCEPFKQGCTRV